MCRRGRRRVSRRGGLRLPDAYYRNLISKRARNVNKRGGFFKEVPKMLQYLLKNKEKITQKAKKILTPWFQAKRGGAWKLPPQYYKDLARNIAKFGPRKPGKTYMGSLKSAYEDAHARGEI